MCTICNPSAVVRRRQNKVLDIEMFVALDSDSQRTEIAASAELPVVTRKGLSEDILASSRWCKIDCSVTSKYSETELAVF
jgi:hypothetical protein